MLRKKTFLNTFYPTLLGGVLLSSMAIANDAPVYLGKKSYLKNAIQIEITPRGQKLFETRLNAILGNLGVSLEEGYFPTQLIQSDKDIDINELGKSQPEAVATYNQVREFMTQWLTGFSLNPHRPTIEIGDSGYFAKFSKFGLVTDQALMDQLGLRDGAVLAIDLEIDNFSMGANSIKAWDQGNEFLGQIEMQDIAITAQNPLEKIKIRLPFHVQMNSVGGLNFKALEVQQNLDRADIRLSYKNLILPQMGVVINGKTFLVNSDKIQKFAETQIPTIIEKVREHINGFAKDQLPALLNEKAAEKLSGRIEQIQDMEAPGTEPNDRRPPLIWGMSLTNLSLNQSLKIKLDAFVEDTVNISQNIRNAGASGPVSMNSMDRNRYDMGLSVDRGLFNRVMYLSFQRRNFDRIVQSDGSVLKLVAPPVFDYAPTPNGVAKKPEETFFKLRVAIETQPDSMWLKKTIVVHFDIIGKMRPMKTGKGVELVLYKIDTDSLHMDSSYLSIAGRLVKGKVYEGLKEKLQEISNPWMKKEELLPGTLPLPPEILGIQTEIVQLNMEQNGHLVLYLNFLNNQGVTK